MAALPLLSQIHESSPLDLASEEPERLPCLQRLLDLGADVNAADKNGKRDAERFFQGTHSNSQHQYGRPQLSLTAVPGNLMTDIHHAGKALIHKIIKIKCHGGRLAIPGAGYLLRVQGRQASVWVLAPVNGIATAGTQAEGASVPEPSTQRLWRECGHCLHTAPGGIF